MSSWNLLTLKSDVDTVFSQAYGIYKIRAKAEIQCISITSRLRNDEVMMTS